LFTQQWIIKNQTFAASRELSPQLRDSLGTQADPIDRVEAVLGDDSSPSLRFLRDNGRYLSPNGAGDTWMAVAVYLRNWLSLLLVLFVLFWGIFLFLDLLRACWWNFKFGSYLEIWFAQKTVNHIWWSPWIALPALALLFVLVPCGWAYWLTQRIWSYREEGDIFRWMQENIARISTFAVLLGAVVVALLSWEGESENRFYPACLVAGEALLALLWYYGTFLAGEKALGKGSPHDHCYWIRNRLSAVSKGALMVTAASLVLFIADSFGQSLYAVSIEEHGLIKPTLQIFVGVSGLSTVAVLAGRLKFLLEKLPQKRAVQLPLDMLASMAALVLIMVILTLSSYCAHAVAWHGAAPTVNGKESVIRPGFNLAQQKRDDDKVRLNPEKYIQVLCHEKSVPAKKSGVPPSRSSLGLTSGIALVLSWFFGRTIAFINLSSLHAFYTDRLKHAYLGASNAKRRRTGPAKKEAGGEAKGRKESPVEQTGERIGDTVEEDDIQWCKYTPWLSGGPLHIVSTTINETVSGKTQIEQRDRRGLILAVGPAGLSAGVRDHAVWEYDEPPWPEYDSLTMITPLNTEPGKFHALGIAKKNAPIDQLRDGELNACESPTLGRWIGISGAAFTTGLGYRTSFGKSFLMGLFNIRLGYWWTSGVSPKDRENARTKPNLSHWLEGIAAKYFSVQTYLLHEFTARFYGPALKHWYLSDGGHFENTAVYELLRRRLPFIVACDNGCDPEYHFEDVANLTRRARLDFNAELDFLSREELAELGLHPAVLDFFGTPEEFACRKTAENKEACRNSRHALFARVVYDGRGRELLRQDTADAPVSYILILKPSITGDEPEDLLHYQTGHPDFPNETTADQYFDEAQWESYRRLGYHIGCLLFKDYRGEDAAANGFWQPRDFCLPPRRASSQS
jgi:hypothetical protein